MHRFWIIGFLLVIIISSCTPQKKLVYFNGEIPPLNKDSIYQLRIYPGDIISINIFTINSEAYPYLSSSGSGQATDNVSPYEKGILVNKDGEIKLPLSGAIHIGGMTIPEATQAVENKFREFISDPLVTIKKLNFKITVLGEVNKPGTYQVMGEKVTLPEALGMAGDLTQFGNRENLRIIRDENGVRSDFTIDLTESKSLSASTYYLHPDDIIYVTPMRRRAFQNISPSVTVFTSILTTAVVVLTLIITTK